MAYRLFPAAVLFAALGCWALAGCGETPAGPAAPTVAAPAGPASPAVAAPAGPDRNAQLVATNLPTLDGPAKRLDRYKDQGGLLVVFVDTRCPFAAMAVEGIDAVADALKPHRVPVVLVSLDDPLDAVRFYYQQHVVLVPVLYDTTPATKDRWAVTRVPTVMLLDATGHEAHVGGAEWPLVAEAAEKMLGLPSDTIVIEARSTAYG